MLFAWTHAGTNSKMNSRTRWKPDQMSAGPDGNIIKRFKAKVDFSIDRMREVTKDI